jgi:hypothetical protein
MDHDELFGEVFFRDMDCCDCRFVNSSDIHLMSASPRTASISNWTERLSRPKTRQLFALKVKEDELPGTMASSFGAFLNKGSTPSTSASDGLTPSSSTSAPATTQPSSSAFAGLSIPSLPPNAASTAAPGSSAATLRLREIAQQSQKLNDTIRAGSAELPKLELSLGMIREKARDMSRRAGGAGRENMQQAYLSPLYIVDKIVIFY